MKKNIVLFLFLSSFSTVFSLNIPKSSFLIGLDTGFQNGYGIGAHMGLYNLDDQLPIGFNGGMFWSYQSNPGNANDARHIFINDNEGGTVEESGSSFLFYLNGLYDFYRYKTMDFLVYLGPRYSFYKANFTFIGDNEDFSVKTNQFGLGFGIQPVIKASKKIFIHFNIGMDYFFASRIEAHGEYYYNPDSQDDNPRTAPNGKDYTYSDANKSINDPSTEFILKASISYRIN